MDNRLAFDPFGGAFDARDLNAAGSVCINVPRRLIPFLAGAINPLRWPDLWKGDPGLVNLTTAQVETFLAALILREPCGGEPCPDCPDCPDCPPSKKGGDGCAAESCGECFMPCINLASMMKIEDGVLYVKDDCCNWVALGDFSDPETGAPDDEILPPPTEEQKVDLACKKASQMVDVLYKTAEICAEAVPYHIAATWLAARWYIKGHVEDAVKDLHWNWIYLAVSYAAATWALEFFTEGEFIFEILPQNDRENLKCKWVRILSSDSATLTEAEWSEMINALKITVNLEAIPFMESVLRGLGRANMEWVATAALDNQTYDCDCAAPPQEPIWPPGVAWSYYWDFENLFAMPDEVALVDSSEFIQGVGVRHYSAASGLGNPTIESVFHAFGGHVKAVYLKYRVDCPSGQGDYEGTQIGFGTDNAIYMDRTDTGDTDPSSGGGFVTYKNIDSEIKVADGKLTVKLEVRDEGDHTLARTVKLLAVGLAGIGTDPAFDAS